jgi:hypothetical protein
MGDRLAETSIKFQATLFVLYDIFLVIIFFEWHNPWILFWINLGVMTLLGLLLFSEYLFQVICVLIAPIGVPAAVFAVTSEARHLKKYLKDFPQNVPMEVVIVLGHADWSKTMAWFKPNSGKGEVKTIVKLLQAKKQNFSFYPNATQQDVEKIMSDKSIKEVYFVGHGSSHKFQLGTEDILYYCDFNDAKYGKEYVHQIHCGTPDGKSLVEYVVPEKNRNGCFFVRKLLRTGQIETELKRRMKEASESKPAIEK